MKTSQHATTLAALICNH